MLPPINPPDEEAQHVCPECNSEEVEVSSENKYIVNPGNRSMNEYKCNGCGIKFFLAMESVSRKSKLIERWSRKVDQSDWQGRMREREQAEKFYIIVKDSDKK